MNYKQLLKPSLVQTMLILRIHTFKINVDQYHNIIKLLSTILF